jgi:hypothetical protein
MSQTSRQFIKTLREIEVRLARERGPFALFALVERSEFVGLWDLAVAAPWFSSSDRETLEILVQELKRGPGNVVLVALGRIAVLRPTEPLVRAINDEVQVEHGEVQVPASSSLGLDGRGAIIITSQVLSRAA